MNCEEFNKNLDNYELLSEEARDEMLKHAAECEACKGELDFMLSIKATMKSMPKIEPPADFMDKLNLRIDKEEKIKHSVPSRIMRNVRTNWRQYTAVAACFALVAVITSNGKSLVEKMQGSDDGVIKTETVITDGDGQNESANTENTDIIPDTASESAESADTENTAGENTKSADAAAAKDTQTGTVKVSNSISAASSAADTKSTVSTPSVSSTPVSTIAPQVSTEAEPTAEPSTASVAAATENTSSVTVDTSSDGYKIAPAGLTESEAVAYAGDAVMPRSRSSKMEQEMGYSLAHSNNIISSRSYNIEQDESDASKAIGKLRVSSDNVQDVVNVVLEYSYSVDGNLYLTDSERLSQLLQNLSEMGIAYTDYTPAYDGNITFRLIIS
jgi:hypothetical protein